VKDKSPAFTYIFSLSDVTPDMFVVAEMERHLKWICPCCCF